MSDMLQDVEEYVSFIEADCQFNKTQGTHIQMSGNIYTV